LKSAQTGWPLRKAAGYSQRAISQFGVQEGRFPRGDCPFLFLQSFVQAAEWWDGIGGQMAGARKKQAAVGKPRGTGARKKANGRTAKLRKTTEKALLENFQDIAQSLVMRTVAGNASCTKLLFDLADGQASMEDEGTLRRFRSLAEEWAAEPKWEGEAVDARPETGCGEG
jgi:hypothetical protein